MMTDYTQIRTGAVVAPSPTIDLFRQEIRTASWQDKEMLSIRVPGWCENSSSSSSVRSADALPAGYVDISWLKAASSRYDISSDIKDYVVKDLRIVRLDYPNRNYDSFRRADSLQWSMKRMRPRWATFIGSPTCHNHQNRVDMNKALAKGIHLDAALDIVHHANFDVHYIRILAAYDRSKDRGLTIAMERGDKPGHSMGAIVPQARCSICKATGTGSRTRNYCEHSSRRGTLFQVPGVELPLLAYDLCEEFDFFESSVVDDPAEFTATGGFILQPTA